MWAATNMQHALKKKRSGFVESLGRRICPCRALQICRLHRHQQIFGKITAQLQHNFEQYRPPRRCNAHRRQSSQASLKTYGDGFHRQPTFGQITAQPHPRPLLDLRNIGHQEDAMRGKEEVVRLHHMLADIVGKSYQNAPTRRCSTHPRRGAESLS